MHHPTDRIAHTTAFVTPVVEHWLEREIAQWVYHMKDRSDDPSHHERTSLPRSYISLPREREKEREREREKERKREREKERERENNKRLGKKKKTCKGNVLFYTFVTSMVTTTKVPRGTGTIIINTHGKIGTFEASTLS